MWNDTLLLRAIYVRNKILNVLNFTGNKGSGAKFGSIENIFESFFLDTGNKTLF